MGLLILPWIKRRGMCGEVGEGVLIESIHLLSQLPSVCLCRMRRWLWNGNFTNKNIENIIPMVISLVPAGKTVQVISARNPYVKKICLADDCFCSSELVGTPSSLIHAILIGSYISHFIDNLNTLSKLVICLSIFVFDKLSELYQMQLP